MDGFADLRIVREEEQAKPSPPVGETETALDVLRAVYRDLTQPLTVRMRAAALALPFEAPKLSAAMSNMDPAAFAAQLERAIARSNAVRVLPPPTIIDAEPAPKE